MTASLEESNDSLPPGNDSKSHLQANCLYTRISSGPSSNEYGRTLPLPISVLLGVKKQWAESRIKNKLCCDGWRSYADSRSVKDFDTNIIISISIFNNNSIIILLFLYRYDYFHGLVLHSQ